MEKTISNDEFIRRANELRLAGRLTWQELADRLGVSRGMLHFIKQGKYRVTDKTLRSLERAELAAGVGSAVFDAKKLIDAITTEVNAARAEITPNAAQAGVIQVPLEFIEKRENDPDETTLKRPPSRLGAKLISDILAEEDLLPVLKACLPKDQTSDEFLDRLTPFCVHALQEAATILTFGLNWRDLVKKQN